MNNFANANFFRRMALALLALPCFVGGAFSANAADGYAQKREMRSVWISTVDNIDWPKEAHYGNPDLMKADLIAYLEACKTANLNSVCFQVRPMCDAFYKSSYEPWSSYLSGKRGTDPGWDPLAFAVQEAHKRGLRIDAWVNPYRYSKTPEQPWAGESWSNAKDAEARKHLLTYGGVSILDPAQQWTIDRIVNVCVEIITKYDVDGLIFDDYFYPQDIPTNYTAGDYQEYTSNNPKRLSFGDWRRDNVNRMVKAVYAAVQQHRPDCSFGISPAGVSCSDAAVAKKHGVEPIPRGSDWQYNGIFSDPVQWLEDKSIDYISPQIYWSTTNRDAPYIPLTQWWSKVANQFGRHHYASHYNTSASVLTPGNAASYIQMLYQISANRSNTLNNAPGSIFFSAKCLKEGSWGSTFANYVAQNIYTHKAIPPAMTWKAKANYKKPGNLVKNGKQLSWDAVSNDKMCRYAIYAVPKSTSMPYASTAQNGINSEYLEDVAYTNSYELPADKADNYWYAVTALDAANNEYEAATIGEPVFTGTKLELNATSPNQMSASYDATSGEYTLKTTGGDPFIHTKALSADLASSLCVVEFDYTSSADVNNLQIFFGNTWSEARSKFFGTMNATSSFKSFKAIITNERNSLSWGKAGETLRLDFGSQAGITIKVKNLRIREMTAAEKENYEYKEDATGDLAGLGYFFKKGENGLWYFHSANISSISYSNRDFVVLKSFDSNYTKYEGFKDNYFIEWILTKSGSRVWYTRARNSNVNTKLPFWPSIINGEFPDGYPGNATSFNDVFAISTGFKAAASTYPFKLILLPVGKAENDFSPKGLNEFTEIDLSTYGVETNTSEVSNGHPLYAFSGVSDITGIGYYTDIKKLNMSRERFGFNAKGTSYSVDADNRQFYSYTPISSADLSLNKKLEEVYLDFNNLSTFDASALPNLKVLNLSNNIKFKTLDITKNTQLAELRLEHNFDFTHLKADKTANAALKSLLIFDNVYGYDEENNGLPNNTFQTDVIDQLPNLEVLHAFSMYIDQLDLTGLKNLKSLWLHKSRWAGRQLAKGNWLHKLDLSQNLELRDVHVQNMHLNALNINSPHIGEDYCDKQEQEKEIQGDPNLPGIDASNNYRKVKADLAKFSHKGKHFYIYYLRTQWTGAEGVEPMLSKKVGEYIIHHYEKYLGDNNEENKPRETTVTLTDAETLEADGLDVSKVSNWRIAEPINADEITTKGVILHSVKDDATKLPVINSNMTSTSEITNFDYIKDWFNNVANFKFSDARGEFVVLKAYVSDTELTGAPVGAPDNICYDYDLRGDALAGVSVAHPEKYKATFFLDIEYPELGGLATDVLENEFGDKPVQSVTYSDISGRVSTRPFNGLNIVVTHYIDGTSKVIKKIYR